MPHAGPLTMEDRITINDLLAKFAWALDTGNVEALVACFTPTAVVVEEIFEEPDRWEGQENIRRFAEDYRRAPDFPGCQHHTSQVLIEGNSLRSAVRSFVFVTECRGEPPYPIRFTGYYDDQLVKLEGRWLFQWRTIRLWDGEILARFPGRGKRTPRKRPPEPIVKKSGPH
ncbi:MAG: nuclear transport factor 2 family protein [Acidobacteriia bacterium]|nr:nuclear transport factor 2 family protein [Terriglobia bacterium]